MPAPRQKRPSGGQTRYTRALGERICERIAQGESTRQAAEAEGVSEASVRRWAVDERLSTTFGTQYARACEIRHEGYESRLQEAREKARAIAEQAQDEHVRIQALKLESDIIKWQLCKLLPHKYGDKAAVELTGKDGAPLVPTPDPEVLARLATMQEEARARIQAATPGGGEPAT